MPFSARHYDDITINIEVKTAMTTTTNMQTIDSKAIADAHCGQCTASWKSQRREVRECPACGSAK